MMAAAAGASPAWQRRTAGTWFIVPAARCRPRSLLPWAAPGLPCAAPGRPGPAQRGRSGERALPPVYHGSRASALRMVAARSVVKHDMAREIHDERVHDREARRVEPRHVKLVMTDRNGDIVF